ncbi:MAG: helix-hairpin-helix domain-containing protein [Cyclobacteriaceae bacterium]
MRKLQYWVRNFFGFSRVEANGFLILLPLIILTLFSQPIYKHFFYDPIPPIVDSKELDSLISHWDLDPESPKEPTREIILFAFDPNTASVEELLALGFPSYVAIRIANYREKGGYFNKAEDLLKIYGLDSSLYLSVAPYIAMAPRQDRSNPKPKVERKENVKAPIVFDLNAADTSALRAVRGIGPVLALRIVKFREKLGGFIAQDQLYEVYGLDSTVVSRIRTASFIDSSYTQGQININTATEQELANHPYINYKLAKSIVTYRFQHGKFSEIDDLLKIDTIDSTAYSKIRPYLVAK